MKKCKTVLMQEKNTDSKTDLNIYHEFGSYKFVMTYRGKGSLILPDEMSLACQFECSQFVNGTILCACLFEEPMDLETFLHISSINKSDNAYISGHSVEGQEIRITIDLYKNSTYGNVISATFIARDLLVSDTHEPEINEVTFYLTNFLFMYQSLIWNNLDDRYNVTIRKMEHYDDISKALEAIRGIAHNGENVDYGIQYTPTI